MTNAPDVRVRLSAEGVAEVVNAFKRVQDEAEKSKKQSADGLGKIGKVAGELKNVLIGLGAVKVAHMFVDLTKRAMNLADSLGKLEQKTGVSVETLSTLSFAARTADVEQEALAGSLIKFTKAMDDYDKGAKNARDAIKGLFGNAKALSGLNQDQRLLKIVDALAKLEPGAKRTGTAMQFFGKSGADLLPLIDDLGSGGFDELREKAEKLGLVIDQDLARAAQQANDAMTNLESAAEGMATRFASGVMPAIANAADALGEAIAGEGVDGFKTLGEYAGEIIKWIEAGFITAGEIVAVVFAGLFSQIRRQYDLLSDFVHGNFLRGVRNYIAGSVIDTAAILTTAKERYEKSLLALNKVPVPSPPKQKRDIGASEDETAKKDAERAAKERERKLEQERRAALELVRVRRESALRVNQAESTAAEAAAKDQYEQGLISLQDYYATRIALARQQGKAEAAALYAELLTLQTTPLGKDELPDQRKASILKASADFQAKVLEYQAEINALKAEETKETAKALELEKKKREEQQQADFDEWRNQAVAALDELARKRREIELEVERGWLFAFEGEQQIMDLERDRLPLLREIADAMHAAAVTPEQIAEVKELRLQIDELAVSSNKAALESGRLKQDLEGALTSDLSSWLSSGIEQAESFADAFRSMALSVVQSLRQIASQMLATLMIQKMLGFLGGAFGGGSAPSAGAGAIQLARGGLVTGPGTGTSDSIAARLSNYEYVMRAAVVKQPGMLEHLNELNFGTPQIRPLHRYRFADGGLVDVPAAVGGSNINAGLTVDLNDALVLKRLEASPEFHRVIVRTIASNQKAVRRTLGG